MADLLNKLESRDAFRIYLTLLKNMTTCVVNDYPLADKTTNHQLIHKYIPKSKLNQLSSNLRGNLRFMKSMMSQKETDFSKILKRKKKLTEWHDYLTRNHMYFYSRNATDEWNYLGLSIHYLLDSYYHVFTRMTADPKTASCFWCSANLSKKWSEVLSDIIVDQFPKTYLYLNLAQNIATANEPIDERLISAHLDNMKFLVHESIK
jgi:hypothetical protein